MNEIRCTSCNRLLAKAKYQQIEIKCPRCKTLNKLKANEPLTTALISAKVEAANGKTNRTVDGR